MNRRTVTVIILKESGSRSELKLDTAKYDSIGFTDESLDEYLKLIKNPEDSYYLLNDRIDGKLVKRDLNMQRIPQ